MNKTIYLLLLGSIGFSFSCKKSLQSKEPEDKNLTKFWASFELAIRSGDLDFLNQNSYSKIQCGNCGIEPDSIEWFPSEIFYTIHLKKIIPPLNKEYSLSSSEIVINDTIKTVYRLNYSLGEKEKYNLIYNIIKENNSQFKYQGMFTVP